MPPCAHCGNLILWGGLRAGRHRFCRERCRAAAAHLVIADAIREEAVLEEAFRVHGGPCPKCDGAGPVDVHRSYTIWSLLVFSRRGTVVSVCCRRCARKQQVLDLVGCTVCGWWSFPSGLLLTPIQIGRNIASLTDGPDPEHPSARLEEMVRIELARRALRGRRT